MQTMTAVAIVTLAYCEHAGRGGNVVSWSDDTDGNAVATCRECGAKWFSASTVKRLNLKSARVSIACPTCGQSDPEASCVSLYDGRPIDDHDDRPRA